MMSKRFVITGCSRSGTTYIADLLTNLGATCSHEEYFSAVRRRGPIFYRIKSAPRWFRFRSVALPPAPWGESAWNAAPYVRYFPNDTVVFHQIREPLGFIRSRLRKGLTRVRLYNRYCPFCRYLPNRRAFESLSREDQAAYLANFWIDWNEMVERSAKSRGLTYHRYLLRDLDSDFVQWMLKEIQTTVSPERGRAAFNALPRNIHSWGATDQSVTWNTVPEPTRSRLEAAAIRYGFKA